MKNLIIIGLLGLLVWFGTVIVRLENYHYALSLSACVLNAAILLSRS